MDEKTPPKFMRQQEKQVSDNDNIQDVREYNMDEGADGNTGSYCYNYEEPSSQSLEPGTRISESQQQVRGDRINAQEFNFEESDQYLAAQGGGISVPGTDEPVELGRSF